MVAAYLGGWRPLGERSQEVPRTARPSWVLRFHDSAQSASLLDRQVIRFVLGKGEQHQKLVARRMPEVDGPCPAALPPPAQRPAELPETTRARMILPASGRATRASSKSRYSSGENRSSIRRVKPRVSTMTTGEVYANGVCQARPASCVPGAAV